MGEDVLRRLAQIGFHLWSAGAQVDPGLHAGWRALALRILVEKLIVFGDTQRFVQIQEYFHAEAFGSVCEVVKTRQDFV